MLDRTTHYVDGPLWKSFGSVPNDYFQASADSEKARIAYWHLNHAWNIRTSGAGCMLLTVLYALRAHMRGKVHCHDMDLDSQAKFLEKALPFIGHFLKSKEGRNHESASSYQSASL